MNALQTILNVSHVPHEYMHVCACAQKHNLFVSRNSFPLRTTYLDIDKSAIKMSRKHFNSFVSFSTCFHLRRGLHATYIKHNHNNVKLWQIKNKIREFRFISTRCTGAQPQNWLHSQTDRSEKRRKMVVSRLINSINIYLQHIRHLLHTIETNRRTTAIYIVRAIGRGRRHSIKWIQTPI